jgi:hypothetical protein
VRGIVPRAKKTLSESETLVEFVEKLEVTGAQSEQMATPPR